MFWPALLVGIIAIQACLYWYLLSNTNEKLSIQLRMLDREQKRINNLIKAMENMTNALTVMEVFLFRNHRDRVKSLTSKENNE